MRKDESTVIKTGLITYKDPEATLRKKYAKFFVLPCFHAAKNHIKTKSLARH